MNVRGYIARFVASGIVEIRSEFSEEARGMQNERGYDEFAACFKDGPPRRIGVRWTQKTLKPREESVVLDQQISEDEYRRLYNEHGGIVDTVADHEWFAKKSAAPKCPDCGGDMVEKTGRRGPFWSCRAFPRCRGSRSITS